MIPRQNRIPDPIRNAEETLRILARIPAPEGLVDRVKANLRTAPHPSIVMSWRTGLYGWMYSPALRGAAAAGIVFLVAGGGWRIYSHVQPAPTANVIVVPARVGSSGGFSNAGAVRKPDTLNGPVLTHTIVPEIVVPDAQNTVVPHAVAHPQTMTPKAKPLARKKKPAGAVH